MEIRRFKNGDEAALFRVFLSSVHNIASRDYTPEQIDAWAPADIDQELWASHMRTLRPFVVEIDGEIAGYADVQPNGYIDHFFVSGTCPGQGVGTLLMNRIHQEARLLGLNELTSHLSKTAESFFLRHGFYLVKRKHPVRRGVTLQNAVMRKELNQEAVSGVKKTTEG
ncbi:TPA: GNAT family N-acetyltransferase [Citrobacter braakii]